MLNTIITGTGSYIPTVKVENKAFLDREFYDIDGEKIQKSNEDIVKQFEDITCIKERRYASDHLKTSDIAFEAAKVALEGKDKESLDYLIIAHNYGDVVAGGNARVDFCPSLASRVKHLLGIENPYAVAYDIPFGCPGWLHGVILADQHIKSGCAKKVLVIGAETLSRVVDRHDRDSMIFADGAGATLLEATEEDVGVISHVTRSDTKNEAFLIWNSKTYGRDPGDEAIYLHMHGHQIYKYGLKLVPQVVKLSLEKAGLTLTDVKKVLIHQANEKMDQAILKKIFKLYGLKTSPEEVMPMTISWLGNSSVATLPTMFDLMQKGKLDNHRLRSGDIAVFASVGAGMNINAMVYRMP